MNLRFDTILVPVFALALFASSAQAAKRFRDFDRDGRPRLQSKTALVVDLVTGQTIFERDPDVVRPIASLSKLMGALVITSECPLAPDGMHEMSDSNRKAAKGGDHSKLTTGWKYSHIDILHAALMRSDNRALPALGESCGMTPAEMGQRMTARARRLGLFNTHFDEPNGLSINNVSTAREMLVILKEAVKVPEINEILGTRQYTLTGVDKKGRSRSIRIPNTDRLLGRGGLEVIGGKTGYTDPARYCLAIALRTLHGQEVGFVLLGAEGKLTRFADVTRVTQWLARSSPPAPFKGIKGPVQARVLTKPEIDQFLPTDEGMVPPLKNNAAESSAPVSADRKPQSLEAPSLSEPEGVDDEEIEGG